MTLTKMIPLPNINVGDRLRDINPDWVATLAASMNDRGLDQPIVVRPADGEGFYDLVAGGHRLQAAHDLGWEAIEAKIRPLDDDQARLSEIEENLLRRELSPLDRMFFLKEHKDVYQRLHPDAGHGGSRKSKSQTLRLDPKRFTSEVAEKIGLGERTVQLAIEIASKLDPEAVANLRGTPAAENQSILQKIAAKPAVEQRNLALKFRHEGARTLDAAMVAAGYTRAAPQGEADPQGSILADLLEAWVKATPATRERFLAEIKLADEAAAKRGARK